MRAILLLEGELLDIYTLEDNGLSEVKEFLERTESINKSIISGFTKTIDYLADHGTNIHSHFYKCWRKGRVYICELKKERHRISCFREGDKLLLATHFIKTQQVQENEYDRAIRLKGRFDQNQIWEEE